MSEVKRYYIMESAVGPILDKQMTYTPLVNYKTDVHVVPLVMAADYARLEQECERLRKQVNMLVKQHMPLEPIDGLDGWSEVISATKAIELRDAALKLLAKCQEKLDPHRDAVLWGEVCDAFRMKP